MKTNKNAPPLKGTPWFNLYFTPLEAEHHNYVKSIQTHAVNMLVGNGGNRLDYFYLEITCENHLIEVWKFEKVARSFTEEDEEFDFNAESTTSSGNASGSTKMKRRIYLKIMVYLRTLISVTNSLPGSEWFSKEKKGQLKPSVRAAVSSSPQTNKGNNNTTLEQNMEARIKEKLDSMFVFPALDVVFGGDALKVSAFFPSNLSIPPQLLRETPSIVMADFQPAQEIVFVEDYVKNVPSRGGNEEIAGKNPQTSEEEVKGVKRKQQFDATTEDEDDEDVDPSLRWKRWASPSFDEREKQLALAGHPHYAHDGFNSVSSSRQEEDGEEGTFYFVT